MLFYDFLDCRCYFPLASTSFSFKLLYRCVVIMEVLTRLASCRLFLSSLLKKSFSHVLLPKLFKSMSNWDLFMFMVFCKTYIFTKKVRLYVGGRNRRQINNSTLIASHYFALKIIPLSTYPCRKFDFPFRFVWFWVLLLLCLYMDSFLVSTLLMRGFSLKCTYGIPKFSIFIQHW